MEEINNLQVGKSFSTQGKIEKPPSYQEIIMVIIKEMNEVSRMMHKLWLNFIMFFKYAGSFVCKKLLREYQVKIKELYGTFIF